MRSDRLTISSVNIRSKCLPVMELPAPIPINCAEPLGSVHKLVLISVAFSFVSVKCVLYSSSTIPCVNSAFSIFCTCVMISFTSASVLRINAVLSFGYRIIIKVKPTETQVVLYEPRCDCKVSSFLPNTIDFIHSLCSSSFSSVKPNARPNAAGLFFSFVSRRFCL